MDDQSDQSADQVDLSDAIDNLLGEIDDACADPIAPDVPDEITNDTPITDEGAIAIPEETPAPPVDEVDEHPEPADQETEPTDATEIPEDAGTQALETIDSIEDSADELLGDAIDAMLAEPTAEETAGTPTTIETPEGTETPSDESDEINPEPEGPIDAPIDAQPETPEPVDEPAADVKEIDDLAAAIDDLISAPAQTPAPSPEPVAEPESEQHEEPASDEPGAGIEAPAQTDPAMTAEPTIESTAQSAPAPDPEPETEPEMAQEQPAPILEDDPVMAINTSDEMLDGAINDLVEDAAATSSDPTPDIPDQDFSNPDVMENLDEALASAADDLLEGSFETSSGDLVESSTVDYAVDPSLLLDKEETDETDETEETALENGSTQTNPQPDVESTEQINATEHAEEAPASPESSAPSPGAPTAPTPEPTTPASTTQEKTPVSAPPSSAPEPAVPAASQPIAAPAAPVSAHAPTQTGASPSVSETEISSTPKTDSGPNKILVAAGALGEKALTIAGPTSAKAVLAISKPLASKSPETRNAVGWVALWTMFLAVVVWGYALLFQTSDVTLPTQAPSRVISPDVAPGVTASHAP